MALEKDLLNILEDESRPFPNRLKFANSAFRSPEFMLQHKEAFLMHWILNQIDKTSVQIWELLHEWLSSNQFSELNRNDINNEEITKIVELIIKKLKYISKEDNSVVNTVIDSVVLFIGSHTVQQYFRYNIVKFFELISEVLNIFDNSEVQKKLFDKNIFHKNLIASENFTKYFLEILIPCFGKSLEKYDALFPVFSQITQKYIFYNNKKSFSAYMNFFFEGKTIEDEKQPMPKIFFKYLLQIYKNEKEMSPILFKLLFHSFSTAYDNNFNLIYQFFIVIVQIIGFDLSKDLICFKSSKLKIPDQDISFKQSQQILVAILEILSGVNTDLKCSIKDLTFSDFLKNILIEFLHFNTPSTISYKIFTTVLTIEPLVIQSLTEETVCYAMLADNKHSIREYNNLIVFIFDIYSRLHRVESLVSKMMEALNNGLHGLNTKINSMYFFRGQIDSDKSTSITELQVENILTNEILDCFSKSIGQLASWQVINVFKTLLHFLNTILENIDNTDSDNSNLFLFVKILSELIRAFLSSIRIAEHTVATNVVEKCVKCLEDLQNSLKVFSGALVKREYNHQLMWSFLNIAYHWAEMYMILKYYSLNSESYQGTLDNNSTSCNISYTHSYITDREWCLLSERITNFGETPCKNLLHKLYVQKLRAVYLFEKKIGEDVENNIIRTIASYSRENWKEILEDNFVVENLFFKMDASAITNIADNYVKHLEKMEILEIPAYILNSSVMLNAVNAVVLKRINKCMSKQKRKHNEESTPKFFSTKIFATLPDDIFFRENNNQATILKMRNLNTTENGVLSNNFELKISEHKICRLLEISKAFPIVFSRNDAQKSFIIYLFSLHKDLSNEFSEGKFSKLQLELEYFIFGILQWSKFRLSDIFDMIQINLYVIQNFKDWEQVFILLNDNVFKYENFVDYYGEFIDKVRENLDDPSFMQCSIIIMNCTNKLKKTKMPKDIKTIADSYKSSICNEISRLVTEHKPREHLLLGYAHTLRHLSHNDQEKISHLLQYLDVYVKFSLKTSQNLHTAGHLIFFITILQNKSKIPQFEENLTIKFWNACKENLSFYSRFEEYSQLIVLIVGHVSNEEFPDVMRDLLLMSDNSVSTKNFLLLGKQLKIWEAVLSCNLNPVKTKNLQHSLEHLLHKLILLLESLDGDKKIYEDIFNFKKTLIQVNQLHLTPALTDLLLISIKFFMSNENIDFHLVHSQSISLLVCLLKYRKSLILDRLSPYLLHYRNILKNLCRKSNSDLHEENKVRELADCAHQLEKLTRLLVNFPKDMGRIGMYLIADILEQYEQVTLYPNVKVHLNNCIYSLMSICDQHAVNYLLRVLSTASTEIFKLMYDNYKKYYRFTGKV